MSARYNKYDDGSLEVVFEEDKNDSEKRHMKLIELINLYDHGDAQRDYLLEVRDVLFPTNSPFGKQIKSNPSKVQKHLELCNKIHDTYKLKNQKYGDSFNDTIKKYGTIAALTRMSDKFSRIENNILNNVDDDDEKLEDNLLDLANYCLMTVMSIYNNDIE